MRSGIDVDRNVETAKRMISEAAANGAQLIATPEMTGLLDIRPGMTRSKVRLEQDDMTLAAFCQTARDLKVWLLIGSLAIVLPEEDRLANRSYLIGPDGRIFARYDKIHMFDVEVGDGQTYRESKAYRPGTEAALATTEIGNIGLTICYDVRFPYLYRALAKAGAHIITCPAAFTRVTGEAHWHILLRARAIETGAFILAPAQGGRHEDGRETFGHSLIVSPWGEILAEADHDAPDIIYADLDLQEVANTRQKLPSLSGDRDIQLSH